MLENSIWAQYHHAKTIREALAALYACDASQLCDDEGTLYAALKRTLTKKELRLFIMADAECSDDTIMQELGYDQEAFDAAVKKTYHKIRNKVRPHIKAAKSSGLTGDA